MGQWSKATVAWLNNLMKPENPQNPTVEEVFNEEDADFEDKDFLEQGFFSLDEEHPPEDESDGSDSDDGEVDEDKLTGLQNEADIEHFNAVLAQAQAMAVKAECEAAGKKPKLKRHYTSIWPRFEWSGSSLGQPEISQPLNIATRGR